MIRRALIVDDDPEIVESIRMRGRKHRGTWAISTARGGAAALDQLAAATFDSVLTDLTMPGVGGGEVLACARVTRPAAMRCVLSGRTDRWLAKDAALAHQVFVKPADIDDVLARADLALTTRDELHALEVAEVTSGDAVPPSPKVFASLHAALAAPDCEASTVARIVEQDIALTSRVLQVASSSALGPRQPVSSVRAAVVAIGQTALEHLVLVEEAIAPSRDPAGTRLREHALLVGRVARALGDRKDEAFLAGVLHDLGHRLCEESDESHGRHPIIGAYLAALWGFSATVVDAIRHHHDPPPHGSGLATIVWLADQLALHGRGFFDDARLVERFGADAITRWRATDLHFLDRAETYSSCGTAGARADKR